MATLESIIIIRALEEEKTASKLREEEKEILEDDGKLKEEVTELNSRFEGRDMESGISTSREAPMALDSERPKKYKKVTYTLKDKCEQLIEENKELKERLPLAGAVNLFSAFPDLHLTVKGKSGRVSTPSTDFPANFSRTPHGTTVSARSSTAWFIGDIADDGTAQLQRMDGPHVQDREEPLRGLHGN